MIAVSTTTPSNGTAAEFRTWGSGFSGALAAAGLVRVQAGGQIDWTSVPAPDQPSQILGHETWRFNDLLQAFAPIYLRFGFGSASDATYPRLTVQAGTAVASDGTLAGLVTPVSDLALSFKGLNYLSYSCYVLLSPERFGVVFYPTASTIRAQCWVERWRRSGAPTTEGLTFLAANGANTFTLSSSIDFQAQTVRALAQECAAADQPLGATTGLDGNSLILYPVRTWHGRREVGPMLSALAYFQGDAPDGALLQVKCWDGVARTYLAQGVPWNGLFRREASMARQCCLAVLWEGSPTSALQCEAPAGPYSDVAIRPTYGRIWPRRTR